MTEDAIKKFECDPFCGSNCCERLKSRPSEEAKEAVSEMNRKGGYYFLEVEDGISIPAYEFEVERLKRKARELGVELRLKPAGAYHLPAEKVVLVDQWQFDHEVCPFLDGKTKLCRIYEDRPLSCASFPVLATGIGTLFSGREARLEFSYQTGCPKAIPPEIREGKTSVKDYVDGCCSTYEGSAVAAFKRDYYVAMAVKTAKHLADGHGLRADYRPYEEIRKEIGGAEFRGLYEYCEEKGLLPQGYGGKIAEKVNSIKGNEDLHAIIPLESIK